MNIRLVNQDNAEILAEIENGDTIFDTICALDEINEFVVDGMGYERADRHLALHADSDCIEINVKIS